MNKYFKSAIERFNKLKGDKDFLINPISEEDSEIITELRVILKKSGRDDVLELLKSYKEEKDSEIKDKLMQWNIDNPTLGLKKLVDKVADELSNEADRSWKFLTIGNLSLRSFDLIAYEFFEKKDKYCIKLNPTPDNAKGVPLHANYLIEYESEEYRNEVIERIQEFLSEQGIETEQL